MKEEIPVSRSTSYLALLMQSVFLIALYLLFIQSGSDEPLIWAAMIYLILAYGLRYFVPIDHRKGLRQLREGKYEEALQSFGKSLDFFSNHAWVDTYRVFTVFSVSRMSFREMAMINKAFALICLDRKEEAKECYINCLQEYPTNHVALFALKTL